VEALKADILKQQDALNAKYKAKFAEIQQLNSDVDATYKLAGNLNINPTDNKKERATKKALRQQEAISDNEEELLAPTTRKLVSVSTKTLSSGLLLQNKKLNRRKQFDFTPAVGPKAKEEHKRLLTAYAAEKKEKEMTALKTPAAGSTN